MAQLVEAKLDGLDALAEQIERAATVIARLKNDNAALGGRVKELESTLLAGEKRLAGRKLDDVLAELDLLHGVERQWVAERKEIANRIEDLVSKLERIDG
jgi:chromosome segregation ATPase